YAATPAYDEWTELPPAGRWTRLVTAWRRRLRCRPFARGRSQDGNGEFVENSRSTREDVRVIVRNRLVRCAVRGGRLSGEEAIAR
ncbi:hypothetical protein ACWEQH_10440, partial [Streptomyces sp. NPDC004166]